MPWVTDPPRQMPHRPVVSWALQENRKFTGSGKLWPIQGAQADQHNNTERNKAKQQPENEMQVIQTPNQHKWSTYRMSAVCS